MKNTKMHSLLGLITGLFVSVLVMGVLCSITPISGMQTSASDLNVSPLNAGYNSTDRILIDEDADFTNFTGLEWFSGDGTLGNPYVISGIKIDANGEGNCIDIRNTNVYFNITDSYFVNSGSASSGIYLEEVDNGALYNNTIKSNGYGIRLKNCDGFNITQNALLNNKYGIKIEETASNLEIWQNYFIYSELYQIYDETSNSVLTKGGRGNYWSNIYRPINKPVNFTTEIKGINITFFISDKNSNNYTISEFSLIDENPLVVNDTDNDGLNDLVEVLYWNTNISNSDTDGDGMPDKWEAVNNLNPTANDADDDADDDGLSNLKEYENNTDPNDSDTDNDGWSDGDEVDEGTDPNDPFDHPDFDKTTALQIPFGFTYLTFLIGSISILVYLVYQKRIINQ